MKYKIIQDFLNNKNKYCEDCGCKNKLLPLGTFDGKTGKEEATLACYNKNCELGQITQEEICDEHDYRLTFFLFFPDGKECIKCGKHTSFNEAST